MKNKTIPTKISFSRKDYDVWKLHSSDFEPFQDQDKFAKNINEIAKILAGLPMVKDELFKTLEQAKSFACSTIIPDGKGFSRVFFDTPNDLKYFIENYNGEK
jgi:hypothetical protein